MNKYKRLARLIEMISLIRYHPTWGSKRLAEYFEISEKRIFDDINELSAANIPIVFNGKGYSLLTQHSLPPAHFTVDEALALLVGATALGGKTEAQAARSASTKLLDILPESTRMYMLELSGKVKVEQKGQTPSSPSLHALSHALAERRTVSFFYDSYSSNAAARSVDPYGIVFRGNSWYMIGKCHRRRQVRTFRLNRISDVQTEDAIFEYPEDFTIEQHLDKSWHIFQGDEIEVTIRFSPKVAPLIVEHQWQQQQRIDYDPQGFLIYTTIVKGTVEIIRWVLSWAQEAEVLSPLYLREEVASCVAAMNSNYNPKIAAASKSIYKPKKTSVKYVAEKATSYKRKSKTKAKPDES